MINISFYYEVVVGADVVGTETAIGVAETGAGVEGAVLLPDAVTAGVVITDKGVLTAPTGGGLPLGVGGCEVRP
jgi:hypothetical protein